MHNLQLILEKLEATNHACSDACENVFWDAYAVEGIETAGIHVFHAIVDAGFDEKGAIKVDNLGSDGAVENVEFHENSVEFGIVELQTDFLEWYERVWARVRRDGPSWP